MATNRIIAVALLLGALALGLAQMPVNGPMPRSTTDTLQYCEHLAHRFEAGQRGRPPRLHAAMLAEEGHRLCGEGHMRPGILRLRRALLLLDTGNDEPNDPRPVHFPPG